MAKSWIDCHTEVIWVDEMKRKGSLLVKKYENVQYIYEKYMNI